MTSDDIIDQILDAFAVSGHLDYGEDISMREHMLQTACLAENNGEENRVVVAALLHDYGHLICNMPNACFEEGRDNCHETLGATALQEWFDDDIVDAVRLHVQAKRFLCATDPDYVKKLSKASITTLAVQGGPMNQQEMSQYQQQKGHELAISIRIYDDQAKLPEMRRPALEEYVPRIRACLL